jgi:hypothetical protein
MSQNNNPFIRNFDQFQFPDWDGDIAKIDAMIIEDTTAEDGYWAIDEETDELVAVIESRYTKRTRKAERNARHAKIRKEGRNA